MEQLDRQATEQGLLAERAGSRFAAIPAPLIDAEAFLDKLTNLWRYEFGVPFEINGSQVWGTHMWVPVDHLYRAITTADARLSPEKRAVYYARLNDPERHAVTLAEMIPGDKLSADIQAEFEVSGYGQGDSCLDWVVHATDRLVLIDVKARSKDFIEQMRQPDEGGVTPEPKHDPAFLFRSLDKKLQSASPDAALQGVWITTHIQQNENKLNDAFAALDSEKVHFAVLGDWGPDAHILARRDQDRQYLLNLFGVSSSNRFTFA